ncbi:MAG: hypothetical protein L0Z62_42180 [Gemmataceae bacterium]|nr:hypothetical protein [Gemmataceae bacterium]
MIQLPRRSITRYFIPLIDVLLLMFCVFLLLPVVNESLPPDAQTPRRKIDLKEFDDLKAELARLKADLKGLKLPDKASQRPAPEIRTLEVDPKDGRLFFVKAGKAGQLFEREYLNDSEAVQRLAREQRRQLRLRFPDEQTRPELHFLIVTPRVDSAFPNQGQVEQYKQWFAGVSYSIDWPGGG